MEINNLPSEIICKISSYLSMKDTLNYLSINKELLKEGNKIFWKEKAYSLWGETFWEKAQKRPTKTSKPLLSYKAELLRIEKFLNCQKKHKQKTWKQKEFYEYWKSID